MIHIKTVLNLNDQDNGDAKIKSHSKIYQRLFSTEMCLVIPECKIPVMVCVHAFLLWLGANCVIRLL